jgi:hypothetical protein
MPSNLCNLDGHLKSDVEGTAEWRRQKAEEFPDDKRNLEAAEALDRLALEIGALEGSELHQQISDLVDHIDPDVWCEVSEALSAELLLPVSCLGANRVKSDRF